MKRNSMSRTLLLSILSLLLCVSMLAGTTFAWFTDEVVSGNNTIAAGNLDIELEYYKNGWNTVKDATDLFSGELWEPGHTQVVYLRLSNLGTLALKYELGIRVASETPGVNVAGEGFNLSDHIEFGVVADVNGETAPFADRAAARTAVTTGTKLSAGYTAQGEMLANAEALYMALVVYMPESVGNEANYRGNAVPTIELGLSLQATQKMAESDSYGNDYDESAAYLAVHFNANGGSGVMSSQAFDQGVAQRLTANTFTYEGREFKGWNTAPDGSGTAYSNGASVTLEESVTLYAQWNKVVAAVGLAYDGSYLPQQLVAGQVAPAPFDANSAAVTIPDSAEGYRYLFNHQSILWIESDDDKASSSYTSTDKALSDGAVFQAGKHYFLCIFVDADTPGNYTFGSGVTATDDAGQNYTVEQYKLPGIFDQLRVYLYVGQAQ